MRAQISFEFLISFLISLLIISTFAISFSKFKDSFEDRQRFLEIFTTAANSWELVQLYYTNNLLINCDFVGCRSYRIQNSKLVIDTYNSKVIEIGVIHDPSSEEPL